MNAKKIKQLRKVARGLIESADKQYDRQRDGSLALGKMTQKGILKELKKSFK